MSETPAGVTTADDPTKAILSESALNEKYLCDYVVNVATGCRHGCQFCYVPGTPNIRTRKAMLNDEADVDDPQAEWGEYVLYRDDLPDRLGPHLDRKRTWTETEGGQGIVGVSFHTDCYMDPRAGEITAGVVEALASRGRYVRVLTRNPKLLADLHLDLFREYSDHVIVGSSINSLRDTEVLSIERSAPAPSTRLSELERISDAGIPVYVSMSPTYPTLGREDLRRLLAAVSNVDPEVVFHEPINPRGSNFGMVVAAAEDAGEDELAGELTRAKEDWTGYAVQHLQWVQELGSEMDLPVHLWPDKALVNRVDDDTAAWLQAWRDRQSPEAFAGRPVPETNMPTLPESRAATLSEVVES